MQSPNYKDNSRKEKQTNKISTVCPDFKRYFKVTQWKHDIDNNETERWMENNRTWKILSKCS